MAAKTFEEWLELNPSHKGEYSELCCHVIWDAATKAMAAEVAQIAAYMERVAADKGPLTKKNLIDFISQWAQQLRVV